MGFFSWDCKCCGHPALSPMAVNDINKWMNEVVVLSPEGSRLIGSYDGYGRVDEAELFDFFDDFNVEAPELWHKACWIKAGKPEYSGPSVRSEDQGWFFNDPVHDMKEPIPD